MQPEFCFGRWQGCPHFLKSASFPVGPLDPQHCPRWVAKGCLEFVSRGKILSYLLQRTYHYFSGAIEGQRVCFGQAYLSEDNQVGQADLRHRWKTSRFQLQSHLLSRECLLCPPAIIAGHIQEQFEISDTSGPPYLPPNGLRDLFHECEDAHLSLWANPRAQRMPDFIDKGGCWLEGCL